MQNALGYHGDRGLLSSLVGWIAGNAPPSFIEGQSLSVEVRVPKAFTVFACTLDHSSIILSAERLVVIVVFVGLVRLAGAEYGGRVWGRFSTEMLCWKWALVRPQHFPRTSFKGMQNTYTVSYIIIDVRMLLMTSILCHLAGHFTIQYTVGVAQKVAQFETFCT